MPSESNRRPRAIEMLRDGVFPHDWSLVPVAGKQTYVKGWTKLRLDREKLELEYKANGSYRGLGVVTGGFSNGLIALDIDGETADERYKALAGEQYMPFGKEDTWTTTSGRDGRRQIFWYVPPSMVAELAHVKKVIRRVDGSWHLGAGDPVTKEQQQAAEEEAKYEELVLRFNNCQSVLPGSPHPITKKQYWFANDVRQVQQAPAWVVDVLMAYRKPVGFLDNAALAAIREDLLQVQGDTKVNSNQMRGWFFNTSGCHEKVLEKLEELVFTPERFQRGFAEWKDKGDGVHRQNHCPWHGGESGTSFQYNNETGCWYCFAEGVGGDVIDFIHKFNKDDITADRPIGMDLEIIIRELAQGVGVDFESINEQRTRETLGLRCTSRELLDAAAQIIKNERNAALQEVDIQNLITTSGLYGYRPRQVIDLVRRDRRYTRNGVQGIVSKPGWWDQIGRKEPVIPGWVSSGCQYMIHSRGGVGKSATAMAMARAVGTGEVMKIRGLDVQVQQGNVIWFSNDQSPLQLLALMEEQNVDPATSPWFTLVTNWTSDQHDDLVDLIKQKRPKLVVMDSLSTVIEGEEIKGEYADYLYSLATGNGDEGSDWGFPATSFLWIHHNRKDNADFRGSDRIQNAVDEVWSLRALTAEEEAEHGFDRRIITIGKSRNNRSGDRFMITMSDEYTLEIADMTPIVTRKGVDHQGEFKDDGLVLKILAQADEALDRKQLLEELNKEKRRQNPNVKLMTEHGIRKMLKRWLAADLITESEQPAALRDGKKGGGRARKVYSSRGVRERDLSQIDLDDPTTWPRQASEWLRGSHKLLFPTNCSPIAPEAVDGVTDAPAEQNVNPPEVQQNVNSPIPEKGEEPTDLGEDHQNVSSSHSLRGDTEAVEDHRLTDEADFDQFG